MIGSKKFSSEKTKNDPIINKDTESMLSLREDRIMPRGVL